jgi:hypothetical protein
MAKTGEGVQSTVCIEGCVEGELPPRYSSRGEIGETKTYMFSVHRKMPGCGCGEAFDESVSSTRLADIRINAPSEQSHFARIVRSTKAKFFRSPPLLTS